MKTAALVLAACLAAGFALAQQSPPSKPGPELEQLKWFEGTWSCQGNAPASPFGPAHKSQSMLEAKFGLGGYWLLGTVKEMKAADNPQPLEGHLQMGYDTANKRFVFNWVDNFGSFASETSPGWQGDTMAWSGDQNVMGQKMNVKDTFAKKSAAEVTHKFEYENKGKWDLVLEETCKKK